MNAYMGMGELDCADVDEYIDRAVVLAHTPALLEKCRRKVAAGMRERFDTCQFVKSLELAYLKAWESYVSGIENSDIRRIC